MRASAASGIPCSQLAFRPEDSLTTEAIGRIPPGPGEYFRIPRSVGLPLAKGDSEEGISPTFLPAVHRQLEGLSPSRGKPPKRGFRKRNSLPVSRHREGLLPSRGEPPKEELPTHTSFPGRGTSEEGFSTRVLPCRYSNTWRDFPQAGGTSEGGTACARASSVPFIRGGFPQAGSVRRKGIPPALPPYRPPSHGEAAQKLGGIREEGFSHAASLKLQTVGKDFPRLGVLRGRGFPPHNLPGISGSR